MPNAINERIKKRRKELKMSQAELANKVGLKPPAISQYESGARRPSFEALRKLSFALNVSTEYLMNGNQKIHAEQSLDHTDRVFLKIIHSLSSQGKEKLLEYAAYLASGTKININPLFDTPSKYAEYFLEEKIDHTLPIDLYSFAKQLGVQVLENKLDEGEGILIQSDYPVIILDCHSEARKKFTLATLLGHYIMPWHLKPSYLTRKYDKGDYNKRGKGKLLMGNSSLLTEDPEEIEAHEFATNILLPKKELAKDFINKEAKIATLKKLADEKYHVSLFFLLNQLVDFADEKYAVVQSENNKIIKTFPGKRPLVTTIHDGSQALTFFSHPSSEEEEVREGEVSARCWVRDFKENEMVYEQSVYNQKYGTVLTLITFK